MKKQQLNISPQDKTIIERQVASGLRCLYGNTIHEPLPERMAELLEQLREREAVGAPN